MPNDADQSLRQGSNSEPFPDLQRRSADVLKNQRERSDEILTYGDFDSRAAVQTQYSESFRRLKLPFACEPAPEGCVSKQKVKEAKAA